MEVCVVGSGYVGLSISIGFASKDNTVSCVDIDEEKVEKINRGEPPIFEESMEEILNEALDNDLLRATTDLEGAIEGASIVFITVGTPMKDDGSIDLSMVKKAAKDVGEALKEKDGYIVVTVKSTVVPRTTEDEIIPILEEKSGKDAGEDFGVCMNPEFLREGTAISDFLNPDRVIIGELDEKSGDYLESLYEDFDAPLLRMGLSSAEMVKYASNSFLANKISFINEIGNICKQLGIDVYEVAEAMGLDERISSRFLRAGPGYGGSCLKGYERVLIKDSGETSLISLSNFFEQFNDGEFEDVKVLSRGGGGEFSFKEVETATERPYEGEILTIKTSMKKRVEVTADHPLLVMDGGRVSIKNAKELEEGDRLPVLQEIPEDPVKRFDLIKIVDESDEFDNESVYLKPVFELSKLKDDLRELLTDYNRGFSYDKVRDFIRGNYLPLDVFLEVEDDLGLKRSDFRLYTAKGKTTYVPAILKADEDFWRFLGYYISEGHVNVDDSGHGSKPRKRIMLSFHFEDEEEYVGGVENYLDELGIKNRTDYKRTSTQIAFSSRIFAYFLSQHLECGKGSYTAAVPGQVYQETESNKLAFLSGLFRGDGHIAFPSHTNAVVYDYGCASEELTQGMEFLLHSLDIVPSYKTSKSKKSTVTAHFVRVSSKNQVDRLKEMFLKTDQEKIEKRLESYKKEIKPTGHKRKNGITTVKVRDVDVQTESTQVYSLEVKDNHTFVTTDGLVVHNCFPKDVRALIAKSKDISYEPGLLEAGVSLNEEQPVRMLDLLEKHVEDLEGSLIGVLGLAFKPGTDDVRESPALKVIEYLLGEGARVKAYDPEAMENFADRFSDVEYCDSAGEVLESDATLIVTDWDEFEDLDYSGKVIIDGRRIEKAKREAETYEGICW